MTEEEIIKNAKEMIYNAECWIDDEEYSGAEEREWAKFEKETIEGLLDLYNTEKDKNASLQKEIKLMKSININDNFISKDKIREHLKKFEEIEKEFIFINNKSTAREINKALIEFSKKLLEE